MAIDITPSKILEVSNHPISKIIERIVKLNKGIQDFWSNSHGWAPDISAELLSKSRLDWQTSLSEALKGWVEKNASEITPGELILAWTNLGGLVEGSLKIMLAVYLEDYLNDVEVAKKAGAYDYKKMKIKPPDGLTLEPLRKFCAERKLLGVEELELIDLVQKRRNAIHAFKHKPIGDHAEFVMSVRRYLKLARSINERLPYPDGSYIPQESENF